MEAKSKAELVQARRSEYKVFSCLGHTMKEEEFYKQNQG
jgi:hypothetical protein